MINSSWWEASIWVVYSKEYGHRKEICYDEIGLCAQNIDTILISIINTIGRTYVIIWTVWETLIWPLISFASWVYSHRPLSNLKIWDNSKPIQQYVELDVPTLGATYLRGGTITFDTEGKQPLSHLSSLYSRRAANLQVYKFQIPRFLQTCKRRQACP